MAYKSRARSKPRRAVRRAPARAVRKSGVRRRPVAAKRGSARRAAPRERQLKIVIEMAGQQTEVGRPTMPSEVEKAPRKAKF